MAVYARVIYWRLTCFLCCLMLVWLSGTRASRAVVELNYDVQEEQPVRSFVGDIKLDANLSSLYEQSVVNQLGFTFMRQYSTSLFDVDATTGVVRCAARVDREQLCPGAVGNCVLRIDVAIRPVEYFRIVRVSVHIIDVNDHAPTFPDHQLTVEVLESAALRTAITLPLAVDPDSPALSVVEYRVATSLDSNVFRLVHDPRAASGFGSLRLELVSELDRESISSYKMTIVAVDGGSPTRSGSAELLVKILDVNDNHPRFQQVNYDVTVPEDVAPGTTVMRVSAVDHDDGLNGRITYEHLQQSPAVADRLPFAVNRTTGDIVVVANLDRDRGPTRYQLSIRALDMGPDSVATTCLVVVQLSDVNDNAPNIVVDGLLVGEPETEQSSLSTETARVAENAREGTFVAHVTVIDLDQGASGQFNCSLVADDDVTNTTNYFSLNQFDQTEFQLTTALGANIDREQHSNFGFTVVCYDFGQPSLTSSQPVSVIVEDANDEVPAFSQDVYQVELIENNYLGASLLTVTALDADSGDNSQLTYAITGPHAGNFRIDSVSGAITALASFDREVTTTLSFTVTASDAGTPSLTGTATVLVSLLDVNDNSPKFHLTDTEEYYAFTVDENQPAGTFVGQVYAVDPDNDANGNVSYTFAAYAALSWDSSEVASESLTATFEVCSLTGAISTRRHLDAEKREVYGFFVEAVDSGVPARSSTVSVVVRVGNVNDNRPRFVFPSSTSDNMVYIPSTGVSRGEIVSAVKTTDSDIGQSTSIVYELKDDLNCFEIDHMSGIIRVGDESQLIGRQDGWTFSLTVTATDEGGLQTSEMLYVVVNSSATAGVLISGFGRWEAFAVDSQYIVLIVCMVVVCGTFIVGLVVLISAVRSRQRRSAQKRKSQRYNCRTAASLRLQQDTATAEPGQLPPLNAWSVTDAAQSLVRSPDGDRDSDGTCNGQTALKAHNTADCSQLVKSRTDLKYSPHCSCKVSGATMRPRQTPSTFNFRSLPRAANVQPHHHYNHPPLQVLARHQQPASSLATASERRLHQRRNDVSSITTSAEEHEAERLVTGTGCGGSFGDTATVNMSDDTPTPENDDVMTISTSTVVENPTAIEKLALCNDTQLLASPWSSVQRHHCDDSVRRVHDAAQSTVTFRPSATQRACTSGITGTQLTAVSESVINGLSEEHDDEDDEAWTTTSGSYNAADLCDEIDQMFFAQNRQITTVDF